MKIDAYNIRVYGLLLDTRNRVLLTDERRGGYSMTKFPGGGHELGEGLADGLRREWQEELGIAVDVGELFYINDFLQKSAFNPREQLLSVYYRVRFTDAAAIPTANSRYAFPEGTEDAQTFRWADLREIRAEDLTFPVDKIVIEKLKHGLH